MADDSNAALDRLTRENENLRSQLDRETKRADDAEGANASLLEQVDRELTDAEAKAESLAAERDDLADKLKGVPDQLTTLTAENAGLKRDATLRDVADRAKVSFAVLKRIAPENAEFVEVVTGKGKDGKDVTGVGVKLPDAKPVPFDDFPAFADFLPSLRPGQQQQAEAPARPNWTPPRADQTRHNQPPPEPADALEKKLLAAGFASY